MSIIYKKNHLAFLLAIAMFLLVIFGPKFALAQVYLSADGLDQSPITRGLCNVFEMANGNVGKSIAIFAIVACGFGFFTGKFSIALVIGITLGIGILFGAPKIIAALTGGSAVDCGSITNGEGVACPGLITFTNTAGLSQSLSNERTKAMLLKSGDQNLAEFFCSAYASNDIRLYMKPYNSSGLARTATINSFLSLATVTMVTGTTVIPDTGSLLISANAVASSGASIAITQNGFCPAVDVALAFEGNKASAGSCATGIAIASSVMMDSNSKYSMLCTVNNVGITSSTIVAYSNATHLGTLVLENAGGRLKITPGFLGDIRKMKLSNTRNLVATCASGSWVITTTTSGTTGVDNCVTNTTSCLTNPSSSVVNINLVP